MIGTITKFCVRNLGIIVHIWLAGLLRLLLLVFPWRLLDISLVIVISQRRITPRYSTSIAPWPRLRIIPIQYSTKTSE